MDVDRRGLGSDLGKGRGGEESKRGMGSEDRVGWVFGDVVLYLSSGNGRKPFEDGIPRIHPTPFRFPWSFLPPPGEGNPTPTPLLLPIFLPNGGREKEIDGNGEGSLRKGNERGQGRKVLNP